MSITELNFRGSAFLCRLPVFFNSSAFELSGDGSRLFDDGVGFMGDEEDDPEDELRGEGGFFDSVDISLHFSIAFILDFVFSKLSRLLSPSQPTKEIHEIPLTCGASPTVSRSIRGPPSATCSRSRSSVSSPWKISPD